MEPLSQTIVPMAKLTDTVSIAGQTAFKEYRMNVSIVLKSIDSNKPLLKHRRNCFNTISIPCISASKGISSMNPLMSSKSVLNRTIAQFRKYNEMEERREKEDFPADKGTEVDTGGGCFAASSLRFSMHHKHDGSFGPNRCRSILFPQPVPVMLSHLYCEEAIGCNSTATQR